MARRLAGDVPATTVSLISGDRDAIVVGALMTKDESRELSVRLLASGKNPTDIYITHGHADHFFGLNSVLETFPSARAVALAEIVPSIVAQTTPTWMQIWEGSSPARCSTARGCRRRSTSGG